MLSPQLIPQAQTGAKGGSILGEWIVFGILASLFFGVVLGIPYLYRLATAPWASSRLHPETAITGTWIGVLQGPAPDRHELKRDPFWSEQSFQNDLKEQARLIEVSREQPRAIYLDVSLDPFTFGSPALRGKAQMCAYNGAQADFDLRTAELSGSSAWVFLTRHSGDELGNLHFHTDNGKLQASYDIMGTAISGTLARGNRADYRMACNRVKTAAEAK